MSIDEPAEEDLYHMGTLTRVKQMLKLPNGTIRVLVEGLKRAEIVLMHDDDNHYVASLKTFEDDPSKDIEDQALMRTMLEHFEQYIKMSKKYLLKHILLSQILMNLAGWRILLLLISH